jgi:hypothetical protein
MTDNIHNKLKHLSRYTQMILRCYNEDTKAYKNYGAKGVTVCDEWLNSFDAFVSWCEANGYSEELVLDKDILSDKLGISPKVYSPETCQFITEKENREYMLANTLRQAVASYNKQGILVAVYPSISAAGNESLATNISRALRGIRKTANGLYWRYVNNVSSTPSHIDIPKQKYRGIPIVEVDTEGVVLQEYPNAVEAAKATGLKSSSISQVVNGNRNSVFGRFFQYA